MAVAQRRVLSDFVAIIMAGGPGSRMAPISDGTPKALLPVANRPLISYILESFEKAGFSGKITRSVLHALAHYMFFSFPSTLSMQLLLLSTPSRTRIRWPRTCQMSTRTRATCSSHNLLSTMILAQPIPCDFSRTKSLYVFKRTNFLDELDYLLKPCSSVTLLSLRAILSLTFCQFIARLIFT